MESPHASLAEVRAYFEGLVADLLTPEGRAGCLLVNTAIQEAAEDDAAAAVVRGYLARLERNMTAALENARRRGEVRADLDPASAARVVVATCQGLMVVGKANPDEGVLRAIVEGALANLT